MFWVNIKRIIRSGFFNFFRNGFVSLSSVLVMLVTLFTIGSVIFMGAILDSTLEALKDKVDIRVTFVTNALESDILNLQKTIEGMPEVEYVVYTSRDEALARFTERHQGDQLVLQALEELGENPLGASLNIKAKDPTQYEGVANFLQTGSFLSGDSSPIIDRVNFFQNKPAIDRLSNIINASEQLGFILALVLAFVSVLITFNTIRLAIYISREEISVMRLVGADPFYIKGPFVFSGILYGLFAGVLTLLIFFPMTFWLGGVTERFFIGLNIFNYYLENFGQVAIIIIFSGVAIGAISSYLAARRYLRK